MTSLWRLWAYRDFIVGSVQREYQSRYRNSLLGAVWIILNPLAMITVYTVVFSRVMQARLPGIDGPVAYSIYLCAGIILWGLFSEIVQRAQNVFIENANLIKKINFPRLCLPVIIVLTALLNFLVVASVFGGFLIVSGYLPGWPLLALLPVVSILVLFAISLGVILAVLNVYFRDVGQFTGVLLQLWFWFTPIVYPVTILPDMLRPWLLLNPLFPLVEAAQTVLVTNQWPKWQALLPILFVAMILSLLALRLFRRNAGEIVDEI